MRPSSALASRISSAWRHHGPHSSRPLVNMDVKLPNLGEGADSGTVVAVLVKPGAQVKPGQNIIELETGKAVAPIPAPAAGTEPLDVLTWLWLHRTSTLAPTRLMPSSSAPAPATLSPTYRRRRMCSLPSWPQAPIMSLPLVRRRRQYAPASVSQPRNSATRSSSGAGQGEPRRGL